MKLLSIFWKVQGKPQQQPAMLSKNTLEEFFLKLFIFSLHSNKYCYHLQQHAKTFTKTMMYRITLLQ